MQVYFYCSYEQSQTGFYLTKLQGRELVAHDASELPRQVNAFFYMDRFQLLWMDIPKEGDFWFKPRVTGSMLGIRNIRGLFAGERKGYANLCFYAAQEEIQLLKRVALCVLQDINRFRTMVLNCLSIGGPCGYQLDGEQFCSWLEQSMACTKMRLTIPREDPVMKILPAMQRTDAPVVETEILRLAVVNTAWKDVRDSLGRKLLWRRQPENALTGMDFERLFSGRGMLWEMTKE
ncbi:MAG: hypothetical protein E7437_07390 [Ruminococcaceae bacterium]|nr:hypothetical protein [Oscillospiraceae bacterium]